MQSRGSWLLVGLFFLALGPLGCGGGDDDGGGACADYPLRQQAREALEGRIDEAMEQAGEVLVEAEPLRLPFMLNTTSFFEYDLVESRTETARLINSQAELAADSGLENFSNVRDMIDADWDTESVVLLLAWPRQFMYRYGQSGSALTIYAGHLEPCDEYDPEALALYFGGDVMILTVPKVEEVWVVELEEAYRFVEVFPSGRCSRAPDERVLHGVGGAATVLREAEGYRMWYGGYSAMTGGVLEATSPDGVTWEPSSWDEDHMVTFEGGTPFPDRYRPSVIAGEGAAYVMYYSHSGMSDEGETVIARAESTDGLTFTGEAAVLSRGEPGAWDEAGVKGPAVLSHDGTYWMWFRGSSYESEGSSIGLATSADGVAWEAHPDNPVLVPGEAGSFDDLSVGTPVVVHDGERFVMVYTASTGGGDDRRAQTSSLGLATSTDGVLWERSEQPILAPERGWEAYGVALPAAVVEGDGLTLWYTGINDRAEPAIGRAVCSL